MRIALSSRMVSANEYDEPRDALSHDWFNFICRINHTAFMIPNILNDHQSYLNYINPHLIVLTGGESLGCNSIRDIAEKKILQYAIKKNIPVLGVCRGLQLINKYFGGSFVQIENHVATHHNVNFKKSWESIYGNKNKVNSYHMNGIDPIDLAEGLIPTAFDSDGYVEGFYHDNLTIASVMWHPERKGGLPEDVVLIEKLLKEGAFWK
jgi:N5-(cytidine 5'-diphosphoramidyl)-L-glutamine hydrolase